MKRLALLLTLLALATTAGANGIHGTVLKSNGQPVWPCNIDVTDRQTGQPVNVTSDSTLANGTYNLVLPDGRYNLLFKPRIGSHAFQGTLQDQRVQANTITSNITLPLGQYATGKVVDHNGAGVPFTDLRFKDSAGATPNNVQDNGTNADGTFNALVDPGTWTVEIIPANANHKVPVEFPNQNLTVDVNLGNVVVQDGFVLTCTVTDTQQFPVTGAKMIARTLPSRVKLFTPLNSTTATGVATIVVPPGTYDVSAEPPVAQQTTLATASVYDWTANADATLPNFGLPRGTLLSAHVVVGGTATVVAGADIDVDRQISPTFPRIETPNDITDAAGNVTVTLPSNTTDMVTINPPVASKCIPLRMTNVAVGMANVNLGTVGCALGHWVDITVITEGTGVRVPNANIDLINLQTGAKLLTVGDVTDANGFARIVSDNQLYKLRIAPPDADHDTAVVLQFRTLSDTALSLLMPRHGVAGVGPSLAGGLRLAAPWPSPSHGTVHFSFSGVGEGELSIVDVLGRRVATPWRGALGEERSAAWSTRDDAAAAIPSGVYFAVLRSRGEKSVRRLVIAN